MEIKYFGIRHHGPGSSKSLVKALQLMQPDVILVEGADELDVLLPYINDIGLIPPVAALIYNPQNLQQAVYYPFTIFSPEWQTFLFALEHSVPVVHMDLPQSLCLGLDLVPEKLQELQKNEDKGTKYSQNIAKDPLGYMAQLAGYEDSERWWEVMFEQGGANEDVFEAILEMMKTLRNEIGTRGQAMNLIREAYMRKVLRRTIKNGYKRIAVVCGAWHCPVLAKYNDYYIKDDNALLKGIPRVNTKATWIPWTYDRIATSSGYGAGVISPAWYELLFKNRSEATILWMSLVSQLFKKEDIETSSAHAIEAVRLAHTLASIRGLQLPGIDELSEAVVTIFSGGYTSQLELVGRKLIIGDKMGNVPCSIPIIPLQQDVELNIKKLKLSKYKKTEAKWLKASSNKPRGSLDLRQEHDLKQSKFLHRLCLLGINWGTIDNVTGRELSTKNEYWKMQWKPDFAIQIIEAGMWGNTVIQATENWVIHKSSKSVTLLDLTKLLEKVIYADLPDVLSKLVEELKNLAAITQDINHLMNALPSLVHIHRYGDVRNTNIGMVNVLMHEMIPRICISLSSSCISLDETAARKMFEQLLSVNQALLLLDNQKHIIFWQETLKHLIDNERVGGLIRGAATRIIFDHCTLSEKQVAKIMKYALSRSVDISVASTWIEGFLHGSGLLLIYNPAFWEIVDSWVRNLKDDEFQAMMPTLRRTFSRYSIAERQKMLQIVKEGKSKSDPIYNAELDPERVQVLIPFLKLLLED
ncbi:DUF5682 family protein [Aureispira]|nr:DUF5682 family protein [Aureispira sp.]